jgi:hypothetical protein
LADKLVNIFLRGKVSHYLVSSLNIENNEI